MLAFGPFFLVRQGSHFIWTLCIDMFACLFMWKLVVGILEVTCLVVDLLQQYNARRETLSFSTQVWVNVRIILATPHNQQHSHTASERQLQHQPQTEGSMDDMNMLRDRCTFFLQDVENWPDSLGSDVQEQCHKSSFLTSGSSASVASLCYP